MLRRAKRAVRDARVTAKARATIETRDEAYARVPLRIDLDDARDDDDDGDGALDDRASPRVVAHYGFDATTSAVSYARDQHALFAASEHGVKAFGARGLECLYATTRGGSSEATRAAYVGPSRVYRCGRDGDVEVWDGRERRSLASENLEVGDDDDEPSCASEAMRGTNFFVTGTANGDVCVHALGVNARGETTLARRGYRVSASRALSRVLPTRNAVAAVRARPGRDERAMLLIAWSNGALALWHLHEQRSVAVTSPRDEAVGEEATDASLTCAEWLDADCVVAGYSDGRVRVWKVRAGTVMTEEIVEKQCIVPHVLINPSYKGALTPIRALKTYVSEDDDAARDVATWFACVGGEPIACPDPVICLRATRCDGEFRIESAGAIALPWFGPVLDATLVPYRDTVESICVLSEGSQLHLHDVRYGVSSNDIARPQEVMVMRPTLSKTCAPSICAASRDVARAFEQNAKRVAVPENEVDASFAWKGSKWPISGGCDVVDDTASPSSALRARIVVGAFGRDGSGVKIYIDRDGRLVSGGQIATNGDSITKLHVDAGGALLIVGRASGHLEIYALREYPADGAEATSRARTHVRNLNKSDAENIDEERALLAGESRDFVDTDSAAACMTSVYTLIGTFSSAGKAISCVRTNAAATLLAVGDVAGCVSLLNLQRGTKMWTASLPTSAEEKPSAVADFDFGLPLPDAPEECVLAVLESNCSVRFHALSTGSQIGKTMTPKSSAEGVALAISLLRLDGTASDIIPPAPVAKSWFTPPTSFAYQFLASEWTVDDESASDDEDKVLSTDEEDRVDSDDVIKGNPKLTAIVVTVAKDAMRAYHAVGCSRGERFTLRKEHLDEPLIGAFAVRDDGSENEYAFGHGRKCSHIVALTEFGRMVTYASPSLQMRGVFGPVPALSNANASCCSRGGAVVVVADDGLSIARLETFGNSFPAQGCIIDLEVESAAEAARAARHAIEEDDPELAQQTKSPRREVSSASTTPVKTKALTMSEALRHRAKAAFEKLEEKFAQSPRDSSSPATRKMYTTTDLAVLFADARIEDPAPVGIEKTTESTERDELFATSSSTPAIAPARRSASSVRAKYGREVTSQMNETKDMLVERGEKLSRLQDKSASLENDAADFAALAREIRKQSERRWF